MKTAGNVGLNNSRMPRNAQLEFLAVAEIVNQLISDFEAGNDINVLEVKKKVLRKLHSSKAPRIMEIIEAIPHVYRSALVPLVKGKPIRTSSGVCVVAVMCKPHRCPHQVRCGRQCLYCPGGPDSDFEYSSQSYTGYEPTSMRAIRSRYDPFVQTRVRIESLAKLGHSTDKVEIILMGGTFLSLPQDYQKWFVRNIHDALSGSCSSSVAEAMLRAEFSKQRCVAMTIETRPDACFNEHLSPCLEYGSTRLEIGVQTVYADVLSFVNRGHTIHEVSKCFNESRDHGFKICAHMMPDLPHVGMERDLEGFRILFEDPMFRPDGLKLYPTLVIRGTGVYELWKRGKFRSYSNETLLEVIVRILAMIPPWTRVFRVQRDIPQPLITSGGDMGNLRENALAELRKRGWRTGDIRTREVGVQDIHFSISPDLVELVRRDYVANDGWETFLSYEDVEQDILIGLLRLRKPSKKAVRRELISTAISATKDDTSRDNSQVDRRVSLVRELHVYGSVLPVSGRTKDAMAMQHRGYGSELMKEAERIAKFEHGSIKLAVIAGVGVRQYYQKLGYSLDGSYMSKVLN